MGELFALCHAQCKHCLIVLAKNYNLYVRLRYEYVNMLEAISKFLQI